MRSIRLLVLPSLLALAATLAGPAGAANILVRFDAGKAEQARLIASVSGTRTGSIAPLGVVSLEVPEAGAALERLEAAGAVVYAERDGLVQVALGTTDPYLNSTHWQLARPGFPRAWDFSTGSLDTIIAVVDTGVQPSPDLGPLVPGYDFVNKDADPDDDAGHGTAVAGIINAIPNNGIGTSGVCWACSVMPVKVLDAKGTGSWLDVAAGVVWAADHGADVINLSLSANGAGQAVADAIAYAQSRGIVVVAAAGNLDTTQAHYPAAYPSVLSVGAVDDHDIRYTMAMTQGRWGSNYGSSVSVAAPGCTITTWLRGGYVTFCGTSAAAPFTSGLVGLLRSYAPTASAEAIISAVRATAVPHPDFVNGRIDAASSFNAIGATPPVAPVTPPVKPSPPLAGQATLLSTMFTASRRRLALGQNVTLTLTVRSDRGASTGTRATLRLPRQLGFVSVRGRNCRGGQVVTCALGQIADGSQARITVVARMRLRGTAVVTANAIGVESRASARVVVTGR